MSSSDQTECPNCGKNADTNYNSRPYDQYEIDCKHCGFNVYSVASYRDLKGLNEMREDAELEPLTELPEQDKSLL